MCGACGEQKVAGIAFGIKVCAECLAYGDLLDDWLPKMQEGETRRAQNQKGAEGHSVMTCKAVVQDARAFGSPFNEADGGRWVTYCKTHGLFVQHDTRALAYAWLREPETWCEFETLEGLA